MKIITLTKKDIIALNEEFDSGTIINEGSLDYALSLAKKTVNWSRALAYLTRSILLDHVFEEGNKRTTSLLIMTYISMMGYECSEKKINSLIKRIILKNTTSIKTIEEMIKNATE